MKSLLRIAAALVLSTGAATASAEVLEIGYMPIMPVAQAFVAIEAGWLADADIQPKLG
jgi:ABC-type nitrate/sulfonate/bicarbonate transport system substrate-binding protein